MLLFLYANNVSPLPMCVKGACHIFARGGMIENDFHIYCF